MLLFRYGVSLKIGRETGAEVLEEARDALIASGEAELAAEAQAQLANLAWFHGRVQDSEALTRRALADVAALPASPSKARVLASAASQRLLAGDTDAAIALCEACIPMMDRFQLDAERAEALSTLGVAASDRGDPTSGIEQLRQAKEVALAANSDASRICVRLASILHRVGEVDAAYAEQAEGREHAARFGNAVIAHFLRDLYPWEQYWRGRWDEAERLLELAFDALAGSASYTESWLRYVRGSIRFARNDVSGALDAERAASLARELRDPQTLMGILYESRLRLELGDAAAAERLLLELIDSKLPWRPDSVELVHMAVVCHALGRTQELLEELERQPPTRWVTAARAYGLGEFAQAAETYDEMTVKPYEMYARLRAADALVAAGRRAEADRQLHEALGFYRSVGAARYVREAEALLAAAS